jgi:tetratricopeptide (TPR) repeat protein
MDEAKRKKPRRPRKEVTFEGPAYGANLGDRNTIYQHFYDKTGQDWNKRLTLASDLRPESFKLGDTTAAKFPYVITPIQDIYSNASQAISDACEKTGSAKRGILILGEANAGKTRLAFEVLRKTLPNWLVLRWGPAYTIDNAPPAEFLHNKHIVIFIDDLQDYVATQIPLDPRVTILRTLLETLTQFAQDLVIIATCRSEDILRAQTTLNWLFVQLTSIVLPSFKRDARDQQAAQAIAEFQKRGTIHLKDWDGTLGSLVLGLSAKNSQYLVLANEHNPAATVLKAMKLLMRALVMEHTEQRIRIVCSGVFGERELYENERVWREAVAQLTRLQFATIDYDAGALVIRKDTYFEKVVTDYPEYNQPKQVEQDFTQLQKVLVESRDAEALSDLSITLALLKNEKEAMAAINHVLAIDPSSESGWNIKSMVCELLGQSEEARTAHNHALELNRLNIRPWQNSWFDRFTEQARKALSLAQEEAQRFQHNYIGTEHLLLGLVREGEGVTAKVLSNLGVELNKVRSAVEFIIGRGDRIVLGEIGLTPRAKKVIELAVDEARRLNHHYIGTEHLLLGLLREGEGIAAGVLESVGVNLERARRLVLASTDSEDSDRRRTSRGVKNLNESARKVLMLAEEESHHFQHTYIGTEHLLLGLVREGEGVAAKVLANLGVELNEARNALEFIIGRGDRIVLGEIGLTPRVKKVLELAVDEARRLNHHYIGTEHLLLGLLREGEGIAAGILESRGINLEVARRQTLGMLVPQIVVPQIVVPQLKDALEATSIFEKFTEGARMALSLSQEEALRFQHTYIGTEHLLLGLVREGEGVAADVLDGLGVELTGVYTSVDLIIGWGDRIVLPAEIDLTPRVKKVLELAVDEARHLAHDYIGTEHLLLGLLRAGEGGALRILRSLAIHPEEIYREVLLALGPYKEPQLKLKVARGALKSVLLEKERALEQQEYELAANLRDRELVLRDRVSMLELLASYLHSKSDSKKLNIGESDVL